MIYMLITCILMTLIGFLSGSVMYSYIIPRLAYHIDIRKKSPDGNPGSMNAVNAAGKPVGLICMALDVIKAFVPVYVAVAVLQIAGYYIIPVAAAAVIGHAFSPFLKFRGGKAVAASFGSFLGIVQISKAVLLFAIITAIFTFVIVINPNSSKVIAGFAVSSMILMLAEPLPEIKIAALVISLIVCWKHITNPNKEALSVRVGPFAVSYEHKKFKFTK